MPIWGGMWLSSAVLFPVGVYITLKAASDSAILSLEAYQKFFNRLLGVAFKQKDTDAAKLAIASQIRRLLGKKSNPPDA